jgi:hypothetical protein
VMSVGCEGHTYFICISLLLDFLPKGHTKFNVEWLCF